ncbi:hypothetical protein LEP48_00810 [Isoptericola sp. NEAU-Y5]|uniref:Uncharacterized protein n=1 Tax=Isoptericola luteus TaxID=2879484 RepID=A0ABS7ZC68_9MICO|nr:hypothetical protein [Isoptericola sp. NEAU-Y5]MCA5891891.1 hypothetical protein [Isoptericola sp. NEAU-Y5]
MNDVTESAYRSIANPRRTTLMSTSAAEAAEPHRATDDNRLQMLTDDGGVCVDGSCALPE